MRKIIIIEHEGGVRKIKSLRKELFIIIMRERMLILRSLLHKLFISTTIIIVSSYIYSSKIWRFLRDEDSFIRDVF